MKNFHEIIISLQCTNKTFFMTHDVSFFKIQNIRLINPEISKTRVHKHASSHGGGVYAHRVH